MDTLTKDDVVRFLRKVNILSAALVGENGPISTPLLFAVDDDLSHLYVATHRDTFKARALMSVPKISASIWEFDQMMIQLDGTTEEIKDQVEIDATLDKLVESLGRLESFWPPVLRITGDGYIVFKIIPTWIRALDLTSKTIHAGDTPFTEILI